MVTHTAGCSAGRLLAPWRKMRRPRPELFVWVSIISQPASNVDSVIFSWAQAELASELPLSLWQRDCFSASFTKEAEQAYFLSQSLSCIIAAKMTARLQLTDTDFSREFKAKARAAMDDLKAGV